MRTLSLPERVMYAFLLPASLALVLVLSPGFANLPGPPDGFLPAPAQGLLAKTGLDLKTAFGILIVFGIVEMLVLVADAPALPLGAATAGVLGFAYFPTALIRWAPLLGLPSPPAVPLDALDLLLPLLPVGILVGGAAWGMERALATRYQQKRADAEAVTRWLRLQAAYAMAGAALVALLSGIAFLFLLGRPLVPEGQAVPMLLGVAALLLATFGLAAGFFLRRPLAGEEVES